MLECAELVRKAFQDAPFLRKNNFRGKSLKEWTEFYFLISLFMLQSKTSKNNLKYILKNKNY